MALPPRQPAESMVRAQRLDAICDQAEAAWRAGERPKLAELIAGVVGDEQQALFGELLALEVFYRRRLKESVAPEEYCQQFPQFTAATIEKAFTANASPRVSQAAARQALSSQSMRVGETLPFVPSPATVITLPASFGRYELIKELGRGAMGVVYLARDKQLERKVALKVPQLGGPGQEEMIERFYREARAAAALRHPHICPVFDVGQIDGQHFISMAFVDGHPLNKFINPASPQKPRAAAVLIRKIALGLQEAHAQGIVHRDLKPGNIMVDARGEPTVMDFGLARDFSQQDAAKVTKTGMLVGTPAYMSPEQIEGDQSQIGPATDIWSLGVILYELLTAQLPFPGGTIFKVIYNIQHLEPKPLAELRSDVPADLAAICQRMLAKSSSDRFASMGDVANALAQVGKESSVKPPPAPPPLAPTAPVSVTISRKVIRQPRSSLQLGWQLVAGCSAAVGLLLVAIVAYSLSNRSGLPAKNSAKAPDSAIQPQPEPKSPALVPAPAATPVNAETPAGERRLFNGQDLTGWVQQPATVAKSKTLVNWVADPKTGVLKGQGLDMIDLATADKFEDFHFRCDWRGLPGWELKQQFTPGIMVRCEGTHGGGPRGVEVDLHATGNGLFYGTGCFLAFDTNLKNHTGTGRSSASHVAYGRLKTPTLRTYPAWNQIEIRCLRDKISVWINEELINEGWGLPRRAGTIVLRDQMCANEFRNVYLMALQAASDPETVVGAPSVVDSRMIFRQQKLQGHVGAVAAIAITADGEYGFSTGGYPNGDSKVRKWNLTDGKELFVFDRHSALVDAVACDAAGRRVLTGSKDHSVRLINGLTGAEEFVFQGHTGTVNMVAVSPDGRWGASTSDDRTVRLWDLEKQEPLGILYGSQAPATHIAISPDSRLVAFGTFDPEFIIADLESRRILQRSVILSYGTGGFSPDGSLFATCHPQGFVLIWDVATGQIKQRLRLGGQPTTAQFHHDGEHVLVSGSDRSLYYINVRTGQGNNGHRLETASRIRRIALARDKARLILDGDDPSSPGPLLETWELYSPQPKDFTTSYLLPTPPPAASDREVVDWILKVGGRLHLAGNSKPLMTVSELPAGPWHIETATLERCPILPGEFGCLLKLRPEKLELGMSQLTDQDLESLQSHLPRVMDLKVSHSRISDAGLNLLAGHRNLGQLDVEGSSVTAAVLERLITENWFRLMALDSRQLTPEVGLAFQRRPRLNVLVIVSNWDAPVQLNRLRGGEPNGMHLYGDRTKGVSPPCPDLTPLQSAGNFNSLRMQSFTFTPEQIQQVAAIRQLRSLHLIRCELPADAVRQLEAALPQCKVTVNN